MRVFAVAERGVVAVLAGVIAAIRRAFAQSVVHDLAVTGFVRGPGIALDDAYGCQVWPIRLAPRQPNRALLDLDCLKLEHRRRHGRGQA